MKQYLPAVVALLLLPAAWWAADRCQFRTTVQVVASADELRYSVNGETIFARVGVTKLTGVAIRARDAVYPLGGGRLTVTTPRGVALDEALPRRFDVLPPRAPLVGDWWVDARLALPHTVWSRPLAVEAPFTLTADFTGRALEHVTLVLSGEPGVYLDFRNGLINADFGMGLLGGGSLGTAGLAGRPVAHVRHLLEPGLRALAVACGLVLVFSLLRLILRGGRGGAPLPAAGPSVAPPASRWRSLAWVAVVGFVALHTFNVGAWVADQVFDRLPHFQDDFCYLLRAKWLAMGHLAIPIPALWAQLDIPHMFPDPDSGRWLTIYPIGWPLLLAPATLVNAAWLVAPLCAALAAVMVFLLGRELYGRWTALAAMLLAVLSPLSILLSGSLLSHAAMALCLCTFAWGLIVGLRRRSLWRLLVAGLALGFGFGIRPLTAVAVAVPAGIFLLVELARAAAARPRSGLAPVTPGDNPAPRWLLAGIGLLALGGAVGCIPVLIDNLYATGHPLEFAYTTGPTQHTLRLEHVPRTLQIADATLATVPPLAFGWGYGLVRGWPALALPYAFVLVLLLSGRMSRWDALLLGFLVAVPLAYLLHLANGAHGFGPRFYYDVFFALCLLTARGFACLAELATPAAARWPRLAVAAPRVLVGGLFVALSATTFATLAPRTAQYRGYNEVTPYFEQAVADAGITRGLILLDRPWHWDWIATANLMPPDPDRADLLIVRSEGDNEFVRALRPDLPVWVWQGYVGLRPYAPPAAPEPQGPPTPQ